MTFGQIFDRLPCSIVLVYNRVWVEGDSSEITYCGVIVSSQGQYFKTKYDNNRRVFSFCLGNHVNNVPVRSYSFELAQFGV